MMTERNKGEHIPDLMTPPTPAEIDAEQIRLNRDAVRTFPNVTARRYVWDGPETCPSHLAKPPREFPMPPGNRYVGTVCVAGPNGERIPLTDERGNADEPPVIGFVENVRTDAAGNVVCDVFLPQPIANPLPMIWDMTIYAALKQPRPEPSPDDCDTPTIVGDTP